MPHLPCAASPPAALLSFAIALSSTAHAQEAGPVFAVEPLRLISTDDPGLSTFERGLAELLVVDIVSLLTDTDDYKDCEARMVEWLRRDDLLKEIELQQRPEFDQTTTVKPGNLIEPTIMIGGTITGANGQADLTITLGDHADGTPLHTITRRVPYDDIINQSMPLSKEILDTACPPGFTASGGGGDHGAGIVVSGTVASVTAPFRLMGEFPGGTAEFSYSPTSETDGMVTYTLAGSGVTGAGTGEYTLTPQEDGTYRIDQTTTGCIDGIPNSCRTNSEVVILTPIRR